MNAHIICWDGVEYDRETDAEEIETRRQNGELRGTEDAPIFDLR